MMMTVIDDVWERLISYTPLLFFPLASYGWFSFSVMFRTFFSPALVIFLSFYGLCFPYGVRDGYFLAQRKMSEEK